MRSLVAALVILSGGCCLPTREDTSARAAAPSAAPVAIAAPAPSASRPTAAPPEWPASFPAVPGGVPRPAPSMGPVRVALVAYPERTVVAIDRAYRDALAESGWTVTDAAAGDGSAHRFVAERAGASVSVSIYRDGSDAIVQTMQLTLPGADGAS